jgi:hypothetical protein
MRTIIIFILSVAVGYAAAAYTWEQFESKGTVDVSSVPLNPESSSDTPATTKSDSSGESRRGPELVRDVRKQVGSAERTANEKLPDTPETAAAQRARPEPMPTSKPYEEPTYSRTPVVAEEDRGIGMTGRLFGFVIGGVGWMISTMLLNQIFPGGASPRR